jgi:HSP20 family protein
MTLPALRSTHLLNGSHPAPDPLREVALLHQRISELMTTAFGTDRLQGAAHGWTPPADITETDDAYLVEIDVPGVNRKDLTVEAAGGELRVTGELVEKEKVGWFRHRTRQVGRFAYRTTLPGDVDTDAISADLADGVLTVRAPRTEAARPRRITVNAG